MPRRFYILRFVYDFKPMPVLRNSYTLTRYFVPNENKNTDTVGGLRAVLFCFFLITSCKRKTALPVDGAGSAGRTGRAAPRLDRVQINKTGKRVFPCTLWNYRSDLSETVSNGLFVRFDSNDNKTTVATGRSE